MSEFKESELLPVNIVGAGLSGCMAALLLSQAGENVRVLEVRDAPVDTNSENAPFGNLMSSSKRSYNLGVSYRGMAALAKVGLLDAVQEIGMTMKGRVLHNANGSLTHLPFADDNYVLSVSRPKLNSILFNAMSQDPKIELLYGSPISKVDSHGSVYTSHGTTYPGKFTIGTDGAHSKVRESMQRSIRMNYSIEYARWGYKELHIPAVNGDFALSDPACLHFWPRGDVMILALPNPDRSYSAVFVMPFTGPDSLETIVTSQQAVEYFNRSLPDLLRLLPNLAQEWETSVTSSFLGIKCDPWLWNDRVILLGDAAHATYPFYGQGMNAAFEDCLILTELYHDTGRDVGKTLRTFNAERIASGHVLCDLSMDNFTDVRVRFARPWRMLKFVVDTYLHRLLPETWLPLFDMVTFTRIPYDQAWRRAQQQDMILVSAAILLLLLMFYFVILALSNLFQPTPRVAPWTV